MVTTTERVRLEGAQTIREAAVLAADLAAALEKHGTVSVESASVPRFDTSALQVLAAAHRTARRRGARLMIQAAPGGALAAALEASGAMAAITWQDGVWTGLADE